MAKNQKRTPEKMRSLVASYCTSGLTQRAFCEKHKLPVSVFQYWYRKFNKEQVLAASGFTELQMENMEPGTHVLVQYPSGIEVRIPLF
jgi:transposase-like protein